MSDLESTLIYAILGVVVWVVGLFLYPLGSEQSDDGDDD